MIRQAMLLLALSVGCATAPAPSASAERLMDLECHPFDLWQGVASHDATILVWWATGCPCVGRYQERIEGLRARYPTERVLVVAVSSNADDDLATLRQRYAAASPVPLVVDLSGGLATAFGARTTPTTVVLDRQGSVRFRGWIDNERRPGDEGREAYVEHVVDGLLAGRNDFAASSPAYGCTITRSLGAQPRGCEASGLGSPALTRAASAPVCH